MSSHSLVRSTYPMMLLTQHEDLGWLHLGRDHRPQIQLPSLNTHETGGRHWVGLQATIFHLPLSTLMYFNSWRSMKNRKNREVERDPAKGSKFLQHFRLLASPSLSSAKHFFEILEPLLWAFEKWMRRKRACHLQKKKKKNTNPPN